MKPSKTDVEGNVEYFEKWNDGLEKVGGEF